MQTRIHTRLELQRELASIVHEASRTGDHEIRRMAANMWLARATESEKRHIPDYLRESLSPCSVL